MRRTTSFRMIVVTLKCDSTELPGKQKESVRRPFAATDRSFTHKGLFLDQASGRGADLDHVVFFAFPFLFLPFFLGNERPRALNRPPVELNGKS